MRLAIVTTLVVLAVARTAIAQPAAAEVPPSRTSLAVTGGAVVFFPSFGARLSIPFRPALALEAVADYMPWTIDEQRADWLFFQAQVRHRIGSWRSWRTHATYGTTLVASYTHHPENRQPRPDGSVLVVPEYRRLQVHLPPGIHGGFGGERSMSRRALVRWDVQAIFPRAGALTVPIPRVTVGVAWQPGGVE